MATSGEHNRLLPASHSNQTSNEKTPQQQVVGGWHSTYCSKKILFVVLCISITIAIVISLDLVIGGIILLAVTNLSHLSTTILTQGTYVKLEFDTGIDQNRSSTLSVTVNNSNAMVDLYNVKCNELNKYVSTGWSYIPTPFINESYFQNCSRWPGKCPFDQYRYLVKAPNAEIVNAINIQQPFSNENTIRLLIYDDEGKFYKYLHDSDNDNGDAIFTAVINPNLSEQYIRFGNNEMIKQQSYYFSVIEEVGYDNTEPVEWFRVRRTGMITSYSNLSDIDPYCRLGPNNRICSIPLSSINTDPHCFIGHYYNSTLDDSNGLAVKAKTELILTDNTKTAKKAAGGVLVTMSIGILIGLVA